MWTFFLHFCVCTGAEQDLQIHAAENNGAHLLHFKRGRD